MARNPKYTRSRNKKAKIAEKKLNKIKQKVQQQHKKTSYKPETSVQRIVEKKLSSSAIKEREERQRTRAEKAKALILKSNNKLKKQKQKEYWTKRADQRNKEKMERLRSVYIKSKLTNKIFKVPLWKAEKYETKWFVRSSRLDYVKQPREKVKSTIVPKEFNGLTRRQRRDNGKGQPGNRFQKRQIIKVTPRENLGKDKKTGKQKWGERLTEKKVIKWNEPIFEYKEKVLKFYEKVANSSRNGSSKYPKVRTDKLIGTTTIIEKVLKKVEEKRKTITRVIPTYYKSIVTLTLPSQMGEKLHEYKVAAEEMKKEQAKKQKEDDKNSTQSNKESKPNTTGESQTPKNRGKKDKDKPLETKGKRTSAKQTKRASKV